ncbi:hypothetical protein PAXRUDRAFT_29040 [Paxillus rubicundulus Ve08.2h10]|uniref:Uncharacterized protein n=1 Tax=Paxillus rubicundulus Ve08.2h10 TaxID=930991 RepID=A0A0D0BX12_9AGAM|nr:hypothetical protein PAXRUDRAFT_29040 [Paxillus rubicundulus Ve08.2h10]
MDPPSENSESIAEPVSHRTHPGNADKHPANILFATGTIQKRRTKAEKAADDKHLKDPKATNEQATQKGIERLALMEMEAEEKASKPQQKPAVPSEEVDPDVVKPARKISKLPQSLKGAIKDYKTRLAAGAKKANAVMPNFKENHKKFVLGSQVKSWADNVAAEANRLGGSTKQPSHTGTPPPSTFPSTLSKSSALTPLAGSSHDNDIEIYTDAVGDDAENWATVNQGKVSTGMTWAQTVMIVPTAESDNELEAPLSQLHVTLTRRSRKCKLDNIEVVSDSESDKSTSDGGAMEVDKLVPRDVDRAAKMVNSSAAKKGHCTTTSTSVGIKINAPTLLPQKKVKCEEPAMRTPSVSCNPPANTSIPAEDQPLHNTESYVIDVVKKHADYNKDLLVPSDQRWSHSFISTATLWCSIQPNMWSVPEEELTSALQAIFNIVYPGVKYQVTTSGSVFSVMLQWLSEWWSGFGSTALAMLIDFFSKLDVNVNILGVAKDLKTGYTFLQEDPDSPQEEGMFCSTFLLELIGSTHLSNITGFVELERAVKFIAKGIIDVEQVLADMANSPDSKMKIKLPKVLNKQTGRETLAPFQFLSANWNGDTAAYRESIQKRGQAFVRSIFAAAQAHKGIKTGTSNANTDTSEPGTVNPRALLCEIFTSFYSNLV